MMFIPKSHQSGRTDLDRILDIPALRAEYRNRCREILDLLCDDPSPRGGQFAQMVDEFATLLHPPGYDYYRLLRSKLHWGQGSYEHER